MKLLKVDPELIDLGELGLCKLKEHRVMKHLNHTK